MSTREYWLTREPAMAGKAKQKKNDKKQQIIGLKVCGKRFSVIGV